ncbi:MAG: hypothetical protein R3F56_03025 [Planctomycetota bacterium]
MTNTRILALACLAVGVLPLSAQDPAQIVAGVNGIWPDGSPSPVTDMPGRPGTALASAGSAVESPCLFAALGRPTSASVGSGFALAVGHEGLLGDAANSVADTLRFNTQAIEWLDRNGTRRAAVLSGHGEWRTSSTMGAVVSSLQGHSWNVTDLPGRIEAAALAPYGVVIIGNAWQPFTAAERTALADHVRAGNGVYMCGVGWSWPNDIVAYPMNQLGSDYGLQWLPASITDPANQNGGVPILTRFYPSCEDRTYLWSRTILETFLSSSNGMLATLVQGQQPWRQACQVVANVIPILPEPDRQTADAWLRGVLQTYGSELGAGPSYPISALGTIASTRAVLHAGVLAAYPLDAARRTVVRTALGLDYPTLPPLYPDLLANHGFALLDNRTLQSDALASLQSIVAGVAHVPRDLARMTVTEGWSVLAVERSALVPGRGVNIFGQGAMNVPENQFPPDTTPVTVPTFSIAAAHEIAHAVDAHRSREDATWSARKAQLLADAGLDDLQYLRSQIGAAFFQSAPQEFFASLANVWFADSIHTLLLGQARWAQGRAEPLKQALFLLDTYSKTPHSAPLFSMTANGVVTSQDARLVRDGQGRILNICLPTWQMNISYDGAGNIVGAWLDDPVCGMRSFWYDDGVAETSYGVPTVETCYATHFVTDPTFAMVEGIQLQWGHAGSTTTGLVGGERVRVFLWADEDGDGDPTNGGVRLLMALQDTVRAAAINRPGSRQGIWLGRYVAAPGFWVGVALTTQPGQTPMGVDASAPTMGHSFVAPSTGTFSPSDFERLARPAPVAGGFTIRARGALGFEQVAAACGSMPLEIDGVPMIGGRFQVGVRTQHLMAALLISVNASQIPVCSRCTLGVGLDFTAYSLARAFSFVFNPRDPNWRGAQIVFQGLDLGATDGCLSPLEFSLSEALRVTLH